MSTSEKGYIKLYSFFKDYQPEICLDDLDKYKLSFITSESESYSYDASMADVSGIMVDNYQWTMILDPNKNFCYNQYFVDLKAKTLEELRLKLDLEGWTYYHD